MRFERTASVQHQCLPIFSKQDAENSSKYSKFLCLYGYYCAAPTGGSWRRGGVHPRPCCVLSGLQNWQPEKSNHWCPNLLPWPGDALRNMRQGRLLLGGWQEVAASHSRRVKSSRFVRHCIPGMHTSLRVGLDDCTVALDDFTTLNLHHTGMQHCGRRRALARYL